MLERGPGRQRRAWARAGLAVPPGAGLRVRLITERLGTGALEVLATSLLDRRAYPTGAFGPVYGWRWGVEGFYGGLKGWLELEHNGRLDRMLYPKRPGSFYHLSKVHDSYNMEFACRIWDLRATDLNQGVVYGQATPQTEMDERLATRFDYDAVFGTVLNRFAIQAVIGHPLTVYGEGGQTRGIIDIRDTVRCIQLACENPANRGEFRVFNQMTEQMSVRAIAETVQAAFPGDVTIDNLDNPRVEAPEHYYNVKHTKLLELGLEPHLLSDTLIESLFEITKRYAHRVRPEALRPAINWRDPGAGHHGAG